LKIDRSFVKHVSEDTQSAEISRTIISLGHTLNMIVVAEGIEHQQQLEFMQRHGCDEGQGYYISEPLPKDEVEAFIRADNPIALTADDSGGQKIKHQIS